MSVGQLVEAGCQEPDPGGSADRERPAHGGRADLAARDTGREVARTELAGGGVEAAELPLAQADADLAVQDTDRDRDRASRAYASS